VLAIKHPARLCEDFVSWLPESNGIFTVRSAYWPGIQHNLDAKRNVQCSSEQNGERKIWELVWRAKVPQKLRIFAWKVATCTLAVRKGLYQRIQSVDPICTICGVEREDSHHALVRCTMARALREGMRMKWKLPLESLFVYTGT
jgi:hypothetical protein